MLISYPVLPARASNESENAYLNRLLTTYVNNDEGRYPVSTLNTSQGQMHRWHGGIHLIGNGEPIRAIADGTVVAYRFAQSPETYLGFGRYDTSFVLIRHSTETGENTSVSFYSLYMHLASRSSLLPDRYQQLTQWMRDATPSPSVVRPTNLRVWRKDVLGFTGMLYEQPACHMEIFATDADLNRFWRDSSSINQGAGSADFFGDAHFVIPTGRDFSARHPRAATTGAHRIDFPGNNDFPLLEGSTGQNAAPLYVSARLEYGRRIATTYVAQPDGQYVQLGAPVAQENYEYELYRLANALYPDCPSAGLEWLRFGRVLGPDVTARNENWQLVRYSDTEIGYVDLAPNAIAKLSDADFVHWQGWEKREEGEAASSSDGICDDQKTIVLCQGTDDTSLTKVRHLVCKSPSEWDASDLAARYGHLRESGGPLVEDSSWAKFVEHVQKMAFWSDAGLGDRSVWHFHPMQFVNHFRKCGWRSKRELLQLVPANIIRKPGAHNSPSVGHWEAPSLAPANVLLNTCYRALNHALRKYCIDSPIRQACFFGNAIQETGWFGGLLESGGNDPDLHQGWFGRGFLQLTNPGGVINGGNNNYYKYFRFLGRTPNVPPGPQEIAWRNEIGANPRMAADSAAAYWIWSDKSVPTAQNPGRPQVDSANKYADVHALNLRRTITIAGGGTKVWYYNQSFANSAAAVNIPAFSTNNPPNMNGLVDRSTAFVNALVVLTETAEFQNSQGGSQPVPENFSRRVVT